MKKKDDYKFELNVFSEWTIAKVIFRSIPRGVLGILSDGDDQMELKVKTKKNP